MKRTEEIVSLILALIVMLSALGCQTSQEPHRQRDDQDEYPGEWMYNQRAFPFGHINEAVYSAAVTQVQIQRSGHTRRSMGSWTSVGPQNIGGRITDIALHPTNKDIMYIGTANAGVMKTTDRCEHWERVFVEDGKLSIGNIALAPSDPEVIYAGTGEANGSATSGAFFGNGIYRSDNGGQSWVHAGLPNSHHIGRIVIDPTNPYRVFAAATGVLYGRNTDRGIYRSLDGGEHWDQVLFVTDSTSAIDIAIDPQHPDTVYAAFWERIRYPDRRDYAGASSGIYRSFDGGEHWTKLTNGLPSDLETGRIGLAVAPSQPTIVYAAFSVDPITNNFNGLYKTTDAGNSWVRADDGYLESIGVYSSFGWYFGNIRVDPQDANKIFILGLQSWYSTDGGVQWYELAAGDVHVDNHALEIHPQDQDFMVLGNDGGLYLSDNGGLDWTHVENLPVTEFYTCEIDPTVPNNYYGGAQDNGTLRTLTGSTDDWERIFGGDGFYVIVDPTDHNIIYCEYQYGNLYKSTDGGFEWEYARTGINGFDRNNWNTPVVMSPHNSNRLYYGTHRLYTSNNGALDWTPMSPDLTNTDPTSPGGAGFGALSTIAVAQSDSNVIYTGSEDGYVYVTFNHGGDWTKISDSLPTRYVTQVAIDPYDARIAYVTISGYRALDYLPHVFRTINGGQSWDDISGNLPEVPVNDIIIDPEIEGTLYVATDLGIWYTSDLGGSWDLLGDNLPLTSYNDLDFHQDSRTLLAAAFGLSMWTFDLGEPVSTISSIATDAIDFYVAPNPIEDIGHVSLQLAHTSRLSISLYSSGGHLIRQLTQKEFSPGYHNIALPNNLASGLYIVTVAGSKTQSSRIFEVL